MSGACSWSKNPTSSAKGATPSGVTLSNSYGRCKLGGSTGANQNDGTLPTRAYYNGNTAWPDNGLVSAGTYANVKTNVYCGTQLPAQQVTCPSLTVNAGSEHVFTAISDGNKIDVQIGECMDVEYDWVPANCSQYHCDPSPAMKIECEIDPQFSYNETANPSVNKLGYVEVTYGNDTRTGSGQYGVSAKITLKEQTSAPCSGTACNSYGGQTYEFLGICTNAYISGNNGTTKEPANGKKLKCRLTSN